MGFVALNSTGPPDGLRAILHRPGEVTSDGSRIDRSAVDPQRGSDAITKQNGVMRAC
jgi:hypothetical protein